MTSEPQAAVSAWRAVSAKSSCAATAAAKACKRRRRFVGMTPVVIVERGVIAQRRPVDQRLPDCLLARGERRRVVGAVADEVGAGVVGGLSDDRSRGAAQSRSIAVAASRVSGIVVGRISSCCASHSAAIAAARAALGTSRSRLPACASACRRARRPCRPPLPPASPFCRRASCRQFQIGERILDIAGKAKEFPGPAAYAAAAAR